MSEYIKREDALSTIREAYSNIDICPSADVVEVVRCKDCKWYMEYIPRKGESAMMCFCNCCIGGQGKKKPTDYCSYGERKDDESNNTDTVRSTEDSGEAE